MEPKVFRPDILKGEAKKGLSFDFEQRDLPFAQKLSGAFLSPNLVEENRLSYFLEESRMTTPPTWLL